MSLLYNSWKWPAFLTAYITKTYDHNSFPGEKHCYNYRCYTQQYSHLSTSIYLKFQDGITNNLSSGDWLLETFILLLSHWLIVKILRQELSYCRRRHGWCRPHLGSAVSSHQTVSWGLGVLMKNVFFFAVATQSFERVGIWFSY